MRQLGKEAGDEAYGGNPGLREWLEKEKIPYVLGIACNAMIATAVGAKRADGLAAPRACGRVAAAELR